MTIGKLSGQCDFGQKGQSYCNQRGQSCVAKRVKVAWLFQGYSLVSALQVHAALEKCLGNTEKAEQLSKQARQLKEDTTAEIMKKYNLK